MSNQAKVLPVIQIATDSIEMALFSRRVIQRMVDHLDCHLPPASLRKIVDAINRADEDSLSFQWELAVLYGLSKLGAIQYEANFGGDTYPDVNFREKSGTSEFVADITCVSDVGVIAQSMIDIFEEEFVSYIRNAGLNPNNFDAQIAGKHTGEYPNEHMTLLLPYKARMRRLMDEQLVPFLDTINTGERSQTSIDEEDFKVVISYDPDRFAAGSGYPSFTTGYAESENTLHNALQKKRGQLNKSNYAGLKGVIICDGGSDVLRSRIQWPGAFSAKDIIRKFVLESRDLDFVMVLRLEEDQIGGANKKGVEGYLLRNDICGDAMSSSALDAWFIEYLYMKVLSATEPTKRIKLLICWSNLIIVVGMSFECDTDIGLLGALREHESSDRRCVLSVGRSLQ